MKEKRLLSTTIAIDLHLHSNFSDGSMSPRKIVKMLHEQGITMAMLTDHDTVDGTHEFLSHAARVGITALPSIEITTLQQGIGMHVLGYNIKHDLCNAKGFLKGNMEAHKKRLQGTLAAIDSLGKFKVTEEEIRKWHNYPGPILSIAHIIEFMAHKKKKDFFEIKKLFKKGGMFYIALDEELILSTCEATRIITEELGGVAVLAHPGKILKSVSKNDRLEQNSWHFLYMLLDELKKHGLKAVEAFHPIHDLHQQTEFYRLAKHIGLASIGGSDFHGHYKRYQKLGMSGFDKVDFLELIRS